MVESYFKNRNVCSSVSGPVDWGSTSVATESIEDGHGQEQLPDFVECWTDDDP